MSAPFVFRMHTRAFAISWLAFCAKAAERWRRERFQQARDSAARRDTEPPDGDSTENAART